MSMYNVLKLAAILISGNKKAKTETVIAVLNKKYTQTQQSELHRSKTSVVLNKKRSKQVHKRHHRV